MTESAALQPWPHRLAFPLAADEFDVRSKDTFTSRILISEESNTFVFVALAFN